MLCLEEASGVTAWPQQERVKWNEEKSLIFFTGRKCPEFWEFYFWDITEKLHSNSKEEIQFYMQFYLHVAEEMKVLICGFILGAVHPQMKHHLQQFFLHLSILFLTSVV